MQARVWPILLALIVGCPTDDDPPGPATVGPAGGAVSIQGVRVTIPPGALTSDVEITIVKTGELPPQGVTARSPVFRFEPDGLQFARPATVSIDIDGGSASVYWSRPDKGGYQRLATQVAASIASAEITHFCLGLAGEPDAEVDLGPADAATDAATDTSWEAGVCGGKYQPCCATSPKCESLQLICNVAGQCEPCGGFVVDGQVEHQPCCTGNVCAPSYPGSPLAKLFCQKTAGCSLRLDGMPYCVQCGMASQPCCPTTPIYTHLPPPGCGVQTGACSDSLLFCGKTPAGADGHCEWK